MAIEEFSEDRIRQFLRYRRKHDSKRRGDNATLRSLLKHLREAEVYLHASMAMKEKALAKATSGKT
jgi:hypothetical protein